MVEEGRIAIIAIEHVYDIFAVGLKSRYDVFRDDLNRMVPVKNLGELRWYGLGFQQCLADACVFRLVEEGRVAIIAVVHVDDIFAVGLKCR